MITVWFLLYILFVVAPVSTFIHELGHAYGAFIVKAEQIKLCIGLGKKLVTIPFKRFQMSIHMFFFLGGSVQNKREKPFRKWDIIKITIFGPLNNALFAMIFYWLHILNPSPYLLVFALFNLWLAIVNIIPFKLWGKESDGYMIVKEILHG